ncbi:hypothetical protein [Pseudidiomarina sediminum]|uniref:hypothetical protein n=1 Tax=Pseudidiomarina sediminum TaxID=431675 RepID=UPI001C945F55|nr:hypothetical protein [Pseudidiomarina sediminum]MBY6063681.1 hypothetical protein [Pseudidiomarina sediminum]
MNVIFPKAFYISLIVVLVNSISFVAQGQEITLELQGEVISLNHNYQQIPDIKSVKIQFHSNLNNASIMQEGWYYNANNAFNLVSYQFSTADGTSTGLSVPTDFVSSEAASGNGLYFGGLINSTQRLSLGVRTDATDGSQNGTLLYLVRDWNYPISIYETSVGFPSLVEVENVSPYLRGRINIVDNDNYFYADINVHSLRYISADEDDDGVYFSADKCPDSDKSATVVQNGVDSGVGNKLDAKGCTIMDRYASCEADRSKVGYSLFSYQGPTMCQTRLGYELYNEGIIDYPELRRLRAMF